MPLNPERGELIEGLGSLYRVVDKSKWASTPLFEEARVKAHEAFRRTAGKFINSDTAPLDVDSQNFIVQEYPLTNKVAFVFCTKLNGYELLYPYVFDLDIRLTEQLHAQGMWSYRVPRMAN